VEASTLHASATLAKPRVSIPAPLLRFRSDEQLVALFRAGHDDAFRAIHERYHKRLFGYARQMLPGRQDAEDALQDVFVRAYSGLRANDRDLALRAWLFRVAHNRCIDELRRPAPPPPEVLHLVRSSAQDPLVEVDLRESLRRLIADVRRLPEQQRSALLLRELGGLSYAELAASLGISIGAVKSVLVRARIALARAAEARDTACADIREELVGAYDRGVRPNANARRHMRDCAGCRGFRRELRGVNRQLAALAPTLGPLGFVAKVLGVSGGAGGGATAGGAALLGGGGVAASGGGLVLGAGHVATLIAAAVATAGGAVEIQHTITAPPRHHAKVHVVAKPRVSFTSPAPQASAPAYAPADGYPATAAVAQSVSAVTQSTRAAVLAHHTTVKRHVREAQPSGTGGGGMIGPTRASTTTTGSTGAGTDKGLSTGALGSTTGTGGSTSSDPASGSSTCSTGSTTATSSAGSTGSTTATSSTGSASSTGSTTATTGGTGTSGCPTSLPVNTTNDASSSTGAGSGSATTGTSGGSSGSSGGSTGSGSSTDTGSSSTTASTPLT